MLLPADADLVRRERAIPGLSALLDPDEFVDILRREVPQNEPGTAQVTYVKYKPGKSCLAAYKVRVGGGIVDVYAKALRRDALEELTEIGKRSAVSGRLGPGVIILEERAMGIFIFPNDSQMKALPRLVDGEALMSLLTELMPERPDLWESTVEAIRYKPERRFIAKLMKGTQPWAAMKVYTNPGYRVAENNAKAFKSRDHLRVVQRLGHSGRHNILVFDWMEGRLLRELLLQPEPELEPVRTVGAALAEMHAQDPGRLTLLTRDREAATLLAAAAELGFLCPHLARRADDIARELVSRLSSEPQLNYPLHGDFKSDQVIIINGKAAVIDYDSAVSGDPAADLGKFLAHLEKDTLRANLSGTKLEAIRNALLEGYRYMARGNIPERIELYTVAGLLKNARRRFRVHEPDWAEATEMILERAEDIFKTNIRGKSCISHVPHLSGGIPVIDPFGVRDEPDMPFLARALNPLEVGRQFKRHIPRLCDSYDCCRPRAIRVTRYKPALRCAIEYELETARADTSTEVITLLGKVRVKGLDETTYSIMKLLWDGDFGVNSQDGISVPEPIGIIPEFCMWLQRKLSGVVATHILPGPYGIALAGRIAEAIHKLHQFPIPSSRRHTMADELRILHERLPVVVGIRPEWAQRITHLLHLCDRLGSTITEPGIAGIHRDFYADQVLIDGPRLYLLDFDMYCNGDPGLDAGNFQGHMTEYALRVLGDPGALADREKALEERFVELSGEDTRASLNAYALLTLVRHIYLSTQFPERRQFTETLLELCEQRFGVTISQHRTRQRRASYRTA